MVMKRIFHFTVILITLSLAASCSIIEDKPAEGGLIRFDARSVNTKALVKPENLTNEQFAVLDLLGTTFHIDNSIKYDNGKWVYMGTPDSYLWVDGNHKFYGYTLGAGSLNDSKTILSISDKTITTAETNQTDILYSNIVSTSASDWKSAHTVTDAVPLQFHHLLSAISITLENYTGAQITVNSASVSLPNKSSASVNFSGSEENPAVTVATPTTSGTFGGFSTAVALDADAFYDVLAGKPLTGDAVVTPYVIWPQTLTENAATITIQIDGETNARTISIPAVNEDSEPVSWEAGKINAYHLRIYPNNLELVFKVQPWEKVAIDPINTASGSINMSNVTWMNSKVYVKVNGVDVEKNTVVNGAYSVYMYHHTQTPVLDNDGKPIQTGTYSATVYGVYPNDVYQTYQEDVIDEDTGEVIHKKGDVVYDDQGNPIIEHHAGDTNYSDILHYAGDPIYQLQNTAYYDGYYPAQGYFTVNYPTAGLYKIGLIPAYGETSVDESKYKIYIYDNTQTDDPWVLHDSVNGESITHETVYFQVRANVTSDDTAQYKAQIDIWFKPDGSSDWISAYSEVRANYALIIPATN